MAEKVQVNFKVDQHLSDTLSRLVHWMPSAGKDRSNVLRYLLRRAAFLAFESPYTLAEHRVFFYVAGNGDEFRLSIERIAINVDLRGLPKALRMDSRKVDRFLRHQKDTGEQLSKVRDDWLVNHFGLWDREYPDSPPLVSEVDRVGVFAKSASLAAPLPGRSSLIREIILGVRQPVAERSALVADDPEDLKERVGVVITAPTQRLEIVVVVDLDLFATDGMVRRGAALDFQLRDLERLPFAVGIPDDIAPSWAGGKVRVEGDDKDPRRARRRRAGPSAYKAKEEAEALERAKESIDFLQARLRSLVGASSIADGLPVVDSASAAAYLPQLHRPREYLFGRLVWDSPFLGVEACVSWPRLRAGFQLPG